MKYIYLSFILFVLAACNKDQRTNRRIDGKWDATIFMGENTADFNEEYIFTFDRDRRGEGTGMVEWNMGGFTEVYGFRYFIKNDNLCMIIDGESLAFTITDLSRRRISLTDTNGEATILEKH